MVEPEEKGWDGVKHMATEGGLTLGGKRTMHLQMMYRRLYT